MHTFRTLLPLAAAFAFFTATWEAGCTGSVLLSFPDAGADGGTSAEAGQDIDAGFYDAQPPDASLPTQDGGFDPDASFPTDDGGSECDASFPMDDGGFDFDASYPPPDGGCDFDASYPPPDGGFDFDAWFPPPDGGYVDDAAAYDAADSYDAAVCWPFCPG
jgi:hypothetical protein